MKELYVRMHVMGFLDLTYHIPGINHGYPLLECRNMRVYRKGLHYINVLIRSNAL